MVLVPVKVTYSCSVDCKTNLELFWCLERELRTQGLKTLLVLIEITESCIGPYTVTKNCFDAYESNLELF